MTIGLCRGGKFQLVRPGVCGTGAPVAAHRTTSTSTRSAATAMCSAGTGISSARASASGLRHDTPHGICEYVLRSGVLYFAPECWHPLANQQRHMENFPA
jgi:alcohol dehydrogenase class IV